MKPIFPVIMLVTMVGLLSGGCTSNPSLLASGKTLIITPMNVPVLHMDQVQLFVASGGDGTYSWSIDSGFGGFSLTDTPGVVYYRSGIYVPTSENSPMYLRLTVTSGDGQQVTATATVVP